MRLIIGLFTVLIAIVAAIVLSQGYFKGGLFQSTTDVTIAGKTFKAVVAKTDKDKQIGLSQKSSISDTEAMLFTFDKPDYYPFWMKEMKFPIDIIFIRENRIVTLYPNVQPPKTKDETPPLYKSEEPADSVLEIKAGLAEKNNFKKGDTVTVKK